MSLLLALIIFLSLYGVNNYFSVRQINIISDTHNGPIYGLDNYRGQNLLFLSTTKMMTAIKTQNPEIRNIIVTKKYPQLLEVQIEYYWPLAVVDNGDNFYFLSADGRILAKNSQNNLSIPVIHYYQKLNQYLFTVGDWISFNDITDTLYFIRSMSEIGLAVSRVDINGTDMILCNTGDKQIIYTTGKSRDLQVYELEQIIRDFKIKGQQFKSLDLRFEKPVVKL